jgi:urea transporter
VNRSEGRIAVDRARQVRDAVELPLRAASQLVFQDHPLSGVLFLASVFVNSVTAGVAAVVGMASAILTAYAAGADRDLIRGGFFGFNGFFLGLGVPFFLGTHPMIWPCILFGGAATTFVTLAIAGVLRPWSLPVLTAPFIVVLWAVLLAGAGFEGVARAAASSAVVAPSPGNWEGAGILGFAASSTLRSAGQIFFQDSAVSGALVLAGVAVGSRAAGAVAALGAVCGVVTAFALGGNRELIQQGVYGYNACLSAVAVGCVFLGVSVRSVALGLVAAGIATVLTPVCAALLGGWHLPVVSIPFTLATWLVLVAEKGMLDRKG